MVYLCTGFTMLPLYRNDGMEPKRRLSYATEIADFYQISKKIWVGDKARGSVRFPETRYLCVCVEGGGGLKLFKIVVFKEHVLYGMASVRGDNPRSPAGGLSPA